MVPSFSIHLLLCSAGFHQPPRYYEEIRLLRRRRPVVVASFGSTARAGPRRPPWVSSLDVPPLPPPLPLRPRMDFGRRVRRHADPVGPACTGVYFRSVLRFASGFFSSRPHGASAGVSRRRILRAVASGSRLLPSRPAKDFHLQSSAHARHTYALPPSQPYAAKTANPAGRHLSFAEICPDDRSQLYPGRRLGDAEAAAEFDAGNAFPGLREVIDRLEPDAQRQFA